MIILYIIFIVVLVVVLLLGTIARIFFLRGSSAQSTYRSSGYDSSSRRSYTRSTSGKERKKIFDADDGEYVDFEEIKE